MAVEKLTFEMNAVGNAVPEMKKVQAQLGQVSRSMTTATAGLRQHAAANAAVANSNKNLTRNIGMASLQFQDMAVQASMGTDAMRIMTMQAPQLLSVFGPQGMILGALVAIGGAMAVMGNSTTRLTFDFKKFGADATSALKPFLDFVKPALELVGSVFSWLKDTAMAAINGIINGLNYFAVFVSNVPAIAREAFERAGAHIQLFGANVGMVANEVKTFFLQMFQSIATSSASFVNETAKQLNSVFNLDLPTDIGTGAIDSLKGSLEEATNEFLTLDQAARLHRETLDKPYESITNLRKELGAITEIDLFSYFDRVAKKAKKKGKEITTVADMIGNNFESAFMQMVRGTKTAGEAFRLMAVEIIAELFRIFVVKKITGFITGKLEAMSPIFKLPARANGGPVSANSPYMVGERGPELFVPSRGGQIIPNGKLSGGGGDVIIQQTINVTTGIQQTVRNEIQTLLPQIAEASKAAVLDARRRGGSFANAF